MIARETTLPATLPGKLPAALPAGAPKRRTVAASVVPGDASYRYVRPDEFTPDSRINWTSFGRVTKCVANRDNTEFTLTGAADAAHAGKAPVLKLQILGPQAFRVRFNPKGDYSRDESFAVVNRHLGDVRPQVRQDAAGLKVELGAMRIEVPFDNFAVKVFQDGQLISADTDQGLTYVPTNEAVANFKQLPPGAHYFGFGQRQGATMDKGPEGKPGGPSGPAGGMSTTMFNYDNYGGFGPSLGPEAVIPNVLPASPTTVPGVLNPAEPMYNSIPFFIEDQPAPPNGGKPYAYGIFFDNPSQSYFNMGQGDMSGKYYFGALYGDMDYYFMGGHDSSDVLAQYRTLVGPAHRPPMWALGRRQSFHGGYDEKIAQDVIAGYRAKNIPLDMHFLDVDAQVSSNRTFTLEPHRFPNGFAPWKTQHVQAGMNMTGIVTLNPQDESGQSTSYATLEDGLKIKAFIQDRRAGLPLPPPDAPPVYYRVNEDYGPNRGSNPNPMPGSPPAPGGGVEMGVYPGLYPDIGRQDVAQWWGSQVKPLVAQGLSVWWLDMTDPAVVGTRGASKTTGANPFKTIDGNVLITDPRTGQLAPHFTLHNAFAGMLAHAAAYGLQAAFKDLGIDQRHYIVARGGDASTPRDAASWTGDSLSEWNHLKIQIPEIKNWQLSGQPMVGSDIGGFGTGDASSSPGSPPVQNGRVVGGITDPELLVRWEQMASLLNTQNGNHYEAYAKEYQEPTRYPEPVPSIVRDALQTRYKLLQLFYDALQDNRERGLPVVRPLFLTDRADAEVYQHENDQFMVGHNLLVAPVITKGAVARDVYLPQGSSWYAYVDNETSALGSAVPGGQTLHVDAPLAVMPKYVRAGAIIPRRRLEMYVGELPQNPLTFDVYPGPDSTYRLYQDDHVTTRADRLGEYRQTEITQSSHDEAGERVQTVRVRRTYDKFTPPEPFFDVALLATTAPRSIKLGNAEVPLLASAEEFDKSTGPAAYHDATRQVTCVRVPDTTADVTVTAWFAE
jgi:alpha-glucosidase